MQFNVTWASATPAYTGMLYGIVMMWPQANGSPQFWLGIGIGLLFGGAMGLPLAASNFVAALTARWLARGQTFAVQFGLFAALSFAFYLPLLRFIDRGLQTMGGLDLSPRGMIMRVGFVAASLALAWLFMALGLKPRRAWKAWTGQY